MGKIASSQVLFVPVPPKGYCRGTRRVTDHSRGSRAAWWAETVLQPQALCGGERPGQVAQRPVASDRLPNRRDVGPEHRHVDGLRY
jgi:hypothetical protein